MEMKKVKEWTEGKPEIQALISAYLVINAENLFGLIYHIGNNNKLSEAMPIGDINLWPKLYKEYLSHIDDSIDVLKNVKTLDKKIYADSLPFLKYIGLAKDYKDIDLKLVGNWFRTFMLNDFKVSKPEPKQTTEQFIEKAGFLFQSQFFNFTLKILIPCVLVYSTTPFVLLRWSLEGDIESMRKLLTLDSNLLNLSEIRQIWEEENRDRKNYRSISLVKALSEPVIAKITLKDVKIAIATLIEFIFNITNNSISRSEIRNLFDAYANDLHAFGLAENLIDLDLPEEDGSFSRAINRENQRWKEIHVTLSES
jgi:hypothetical protein